MGGWWVADNSSYCGGPRYYMDCNSTCTCASGCGGGFPFCEPGCDQTGCGCGSHGCDSYLTGCLQFRYGQCNQDVACMGRIVCRVVACVPPWQVDPSCTTVVAVDNSTAEQNEPCWTPAPPMPPCTSVATNCKVVGIAASGDDAGYAVFTSTGKLFGFGDFVSQGDASDLALDGPIVAVAGCPTGGYYLVACRRRHLRLRRCAVPRIDGRAASERPGGGDGGHADGPGVLAGRRRRRHLRLRRCAVPRDRWADST